MDVPQPNKPGPSAEVQDADASDETNDEGEGIATEILMESVVRVTLAGLGGSIVGLSQEKRLESMRVSPAKTALARRKRGKMMSNLPLTWALSCMAFCTIIETCRLTSPSTMIVRALEPSTGFPSNSLGTNLSQPITTISDYTIGGACAGIAGSFGRNTLLRKRLPVAMFRGSQRFFGLVPGIALGIIAGGVQAGLDYGVQYFEIAARQSR